MRNIRRNIRWPSRQTRRGLATLEVVMTMGTVFVFTVVLYKMAVMSCHNLYHMIGSMVGTPYL
jgi:hypothetical protein